MAVVGSLSPHIPIPASRFSDATPAAALDRGETTAAAAVDSAGSLSLEATAAAREGKGKVVWSVQLRPKLSLESFGFGL